MGLIQKSNKVLGIFLVLFLMISMMAPVSVFAEWDSESSAIEKVALGGSLTSRELAYAIKEANAKSGQASADQLEDETYIWVKVKGVPTELMKAADTHIEINKNVWGSAKSNDVSKVMQNFVSALGESGASDDAIQSFMNEFQNADSSISSVMLTMSFSKTRADLYQAYLIMEPFLEILNVVLGVGCVCLILLLFGSTVLDLAYIGLPVWREAQESKNGGKKNPFGVSFEAMKTVEEVEKGIGGGDGGYKNAYLLYFKRRALTYIILALCIMYLICGGISGLIGFVLNLVGGIAG